MKTLASIDVGSNAMRLAIGVIGNDKKMRVVKTIRASVRLGRDVFKTGFIEKGTAKDAASAFVQFRKQMQKYNVRFVKAIATSATREAANRREFIEFLALKSGIHLSLIDGDEEAHLIHLMMKEKFRLQDKKSLVLDIGGGSIEVVLAESGELKLARSFPIGTVRLLQHGEHIERMISKTSIQVRRALTDVGFKDPIQLFIGTGGNIEALGRLRKKILKASQPHFLTFSELDQILTKLKSMTYKDRMSKLELRKDRADVIVPAAQVLKMVMEASRSRKILIPGVGLKDAVLLDMKKVLEGKSESIGCRCWRI